MAERIVKMRQTLASDVDWTAINGTVEDLVDGGYDITLKPEDAIYKGLWVDPRAFGAAFDGVTDDTTAIQAAIDYSVTSEIKTVGFPPGRTTCISSALVLPAPNGGTAWGDRLNITLTGIFGLCRIKMLGSANMIESYDVTTDPGDLLWSFGINLCNLYLDGNNFAKSAIRLVRCAQNVLIKDVHVTDCEEHGIYLTKCLETKLDHCISRRCKTQDYSNLCIEDGTTTSIVGGAYFSGYNGVYFRFAGRDFAGTNGQHSVSCTGATVIEANDNYGLWIESGERMVFEMVHLENNATNIMIEDNSAGVDEPRGIKFDRCNMAAADNEMFNLGVGCQHIQFLECRGKAATTTFTGTSAASYVYIRNCTYRNDLKPWSVNKTGGSIIYEYTGGIELPTGSTVCWYGDADDHGKHISQGGDGYCDNQVQIMDGKEVRVYGAVGDSDQQFKIYTMDAGTQSTVPVLALGHEAGDPFIYMGDGDSYDCRITRASADLIRTGSNDRFFGQAGLITKATVDNVADPPTEAQLQAVFEGTYTMEDGFIGIINDNNDDTDVWVCIKSGGSWFTFNILDVTSGNKAS